jgi:GAF domain-containing protein
MSRESVLVGTLVEMADNLVDDYDVIDVLTVLSDRCVEVLDVDSAGVMLAAPSGALQVVASSSDAMRVLELFELQSDEGPCVDCFRTGVAVVNGELSPVDDRWPRFARLALRDGFHAVHAVPMQLRGRTIGALNLFRTAAGALAPDDVLVAQALADVASIAIIQHQVSLDAAVLNVQLNEALNSRVIIEQTKGKVAQSFGIDVDRAFQRLRTHARNHNVRLTDLCRSVADGTTLPAALDPPVAARQVRAISSNPRTVRRSD